MLIQELVHVTPLGLLQMGCLEFSTPVQCGLNACTVWVVLLQVVLNRLSASSGKEWVKVGIGASHRHGFIGCTKAACFSLVYILLDREHIMLD